MNRPGVLLLAFTIAVLIFTLVIVESAGSEPIPPRQHTCITHAGDLEPYVVRSLALWGRYSAITDCGHVPAATSAPWPDITVKHIENPGAGFRGVTYPYPEYAYIVNLQPESRECASSGFVCADTSADFRPLLRHPDSEGYAGVPVCHRFVAHPSLTPFP